VAVKAILCLFLKFIETINIPVILLLFFGSRA
jgi:hypothetical protein